MSYLRTDQGRHKANIYRIDADVVMIAEVNSGYTWPQARGEDEKTWTAGVDFCSAGETVCQRLIDSNGDFLFSIELMLSALEICGVDNAR